MKEHLFIEDLIVECEGYLSKGDLVTGKLYLDRIYVLLPKFRDQYKDFIYKKYEKFFKKYGGKE